MTITPTGLEGLRKGGQQRWAMHRKGLSLYLHQHGMTLTQLTNALRALRRAEGNPVRAKMLCVADVRAFVEGQYIPGHLTAGEIERATAGAVPSTTWPVGCGRRVKGAAR